MKIGILGDIHGNSEALFCVLEAIKAEGIKKLFITGDLVGYYYNAKEVLSLLSNWDCIFVKGNHEEMLQKCMNDSDFLADVTKKYGSGIEIALNSLSHDQLNFLCNLPLSISVTLENTSFLICHGSPVSANDYLYPDASREEVKNFLEIEEDILVHGHTHYPATFTLNNKKIINPGSVGQTRNGLHGAYWGYYDLENNTFTQRSEFYDTKSLLNEVKQINPNLNYLSKILTRKINE
jgi:putative phosphoesterase